MAPRLYHISENPNLTTMTPRIPNNRLVKAGYENGTIGRVCFAPSIDYAIAAAPRGKAGELLYVYIPTSVDKSAVYHPTPQEVPDVTYTHEVWYLKPVTVKKVGVILVGDAYLEQKFLGPGSYNKHFVLRFQKFKRFKNLPTDEETREYWKENPVYYKQFIEEEKRKQRNEKVGKIAKKALIASAGVGLFMLVGNKLKNIVKEKLVNDSAYYDSMPNRRLQDAINLNIIRLQKQKEFLHKEGVATHYTVLEGNHNLGTIIAVTGSLAGNKPGNIRLIYRIAPEFDDRALHAHIIKHFFKDYGNQKSLGVMTFKSTDL